jgi:hypothetical protein
MESCTLQHPRPVPALEPPDSGIETRWDYYAQPMGTQLGWAIELRSDRVTLRVLDAIPERRWIRLRFKLPGSGIPVIATGQVLECRSARFQGIARFEARIRFRTPIRWIAPPAEDWLKAEDLLSSSLPAHLPLEQFLTRLLPDPNRGTPVRESSSP